MENTFCPMAANLESALMLYHGYVIKLTDLWKKNYVHVSYYVIGLSMVTFLTLKK